MGGAGKFAPSSETPPAPPSPLPPRPSSGKSLLLPSFVLHSFTHSVHSFAYLIHALRLYLNELANSLLIISERMNETES